MANNVNTEDEFGRQIHPVLCNTAKDGSGTWYFALVDSNGRLVVKTSIPVITPYTGTGTAIGTLAPGAAFRLLGFRLHLGSALAAAETLTITLDDGVGGAYDTVLFSSDLGTPDIRDVVIEFPRNSAYEFNSADKIVIALSANTGGDTYGCKIIHELI